MFGTRCKSGTLALFAAACIGCLLANSVFVWQHCLSFAESTSHPLFVRRTFNFETHQPHRCRQLRKPHRRRLHVDVGMAAQSLDSESEPTTREAATGEQSRAQVIVCQGSSCLGRCVGNFDPMDSFKELAAKNGPAVGLEQVSCMNMCKKGPNAQLVLDGELVIVSGQMSEVEERRKAFQGLSSHERVARVWKLLQGLLDGSVQGALHGPPTL
eukprot:TRINITY_DN59613_c0_g1_i1.p1 TRINITY_DN59613_c0_g1~~TRINITY_DN59613_c0_g1_i1.p1  ORF type:complete len:213 (+),score=32.14 TRINITY_DN59613_c0_g1_i1:60-698(+)